MAGQRGLVALLLLLDTPIATDAGLLRAVIIVTTTVMLDSDR